jgi:hypothetical protein
VKRVVMVLCLILTLWLSSCAQDERGQVIEQPASASLETEPMTNIWPAMSTNGLRITIEREI